ncbi:hypothetical protein AGDE_17182 [Angomonas deanei]|uniref:Uncharacterized protein n=1 Tax=Angomonas deanei TaxID=59799 RepID=A0A7G2C395_9TRYP|nr:hypothetical protein AGDE_17182 [Angomonas deanei]CAD2214150.1 hypothetical protein, conserved [Angomonas deanei]|eukprot:EPY15092.1 hypothetical protein AGDE_17182 [Angomonas deanei]
MEDSSPTVSLLMHSSTGLSLPITFDSNEATSMHATRKIFGVHRLGKAVSLLKSSGVLQDANATFENRQTTTPREAGKYEKANTIQSSLFKEKRTPSASAGVTHQSVNVVHIGGVVKKVECGYMKHHSKQSPCVTVGEHVGMCLLQMWLSVTEEILGATTSVEARKTAEVPLAVRCVLSEEFLAAKNSAKFDLTQKEENLRLFSKSIQNKFFGRVVMVRGKLSCEQLYDNDANTITTVPVVVLPNDSVLSNCRRIVL